jgi:hypothetical protein
MILRDSSKEDPGDGENSSESQFIFRDNPEPSL